MSAGFVLLGAFVAVTGLVGVESAIGAMRQLVPAYRTQHVEANERAIRAGAGLLPALAAPAWDHKPSVVA
jgi:Pyruvate/2-oxoacid:ferredoxin oxidoreductase gamma subunit